MYFSLFFSFGNTVFAGNKLIDYYKSSIGLHIMFRRTATRIIRKALFYSLASPFTLIVGLIINIVIVVVT
jgi:hypothetical protein